MAFAVQKTSIVKGAVAPAGAAKILTADAVDLAVAALQDVSGYSTGMVLDYVRAKNASSASAAFKSRAGATVTPNSAVVFVASDSNMGGQKVFDLTNATTEGMPSSVPCAASFTFIFPIRLTSLRAINHIFGVVGSKFAAYLNNLGKVVMDAAYGSGEASFTFANIAFPVNTTLLGWISFDATTKTMRYGTGVSVSESHVTTDSHTVDSASIARPFSFYQSQTSSIPIAHTEGYLLLNKAYAADGSAADTAIATVISAWKSLVAGS